MTDDMQEALSIAYCTSRIVRLTSGNYALYAPWSGGHEIIHIGPWAELEGLVPTYDELHTWHDANTYASKSAPGIDLSKMLGLTSVTNIARRL